MLVLSRKPGESIVINDEIVVTFVSLKGDRIRLGIEAPKHVSVDRAEVHASKRPVAEETVGSLADAGLVEVSTGTGETP